ncbi:hypothetical protein GCM10027215_16870 [Nocardioides zeae]
MKTLKQFMLAVLVCSAVGGAAAYAIAVPTIPLGARVAIAMSVLLVPILGLLGWARKKTRPIVRNFDTRAEVLLDSLSRAVTIVGAEKIEDRPTSGSILVKTPRSAWSWGSVWRLQASRSERGSVAVGEIMRRGSVVAGVTEAGLIERIFDEVEKESPKSI